ncbi:MAG TPA: HAMP domain-containing sensor histidine kinase [Burkholderiaceae bacterium]|jgi:signal transduction histidine kinase
MSDSVPAASAALPATESCFVPTAAAAERALDSQRAVRYGALLQLIDEIQRLREIAEVASVAASRWKHCANVAQWRLLCVHRGRVALVIARGRVAEVREMGFDELEPWDAAQWQRMLPSYDNGARLLALRAGLPDTLADERGAELAILPVTQGGEPIALLSALSFDAVFDLLDRKFLGHVAGAMAGRITALMTERLLAAELVEAENQIAEQRHVAILGRLVNGVAHELNTPLGVQISACDSLGAALQGNQPLEAQELLDTVELIHQQAKRAARIVRRLKQVSAASQSGTPVVTELLATIESVAVACAGRPDAPQISLVGDEAIELEIDREAFSVLLYELIENAGVHGRRPDGPCELTLELGRSAEAVWIDIRDDGPGMPPGIAARFFQPFVTTRQSQGHMGLGGYIVRSLARDALQAGVSLMSADPNDDAGSAGVWIRLEFGASDRAETAFGLSLPS